MSDQPPVDPPHVDPPSLDPLPFDGQALPVTTDNAEDAGRRTHPLTGLVQGLLWAAAAFVAIVGSILGRTDGGVATVVFSVGGAAAAGLLIGLLAGYVTWYFTRFVIDATELRITRGFLFKQSRRIPFERIQAVDVAEPFIARIIGLAELHIDMAGGHESRTTLRYLPLNDVRQLRRLLLARAHGEELDDSGRPVADEARTLITRVPPGRIVIGTLLSLDLVGAVIGLVAAVVAGIVAEQVLIALGGILPFGAAIVQIFTRRVLDQWDFTLSRGERGLRIERGLLSRTSQTIPYDRVQGIAVKEPFVWRHLGWQRLEVDVAGYAGQSEQSGGHDSSTLLPITDPALAEAVTAELVPSRTETLTIDRPTRRSWPFAPIGWRYRWTEARAGLVVSQRGWIERTTSLVPHHKVQSVEIRQGPLQRWRDVATVEVHSPPGPVDLDADHLDAVDARRFWRDQVTRI